MGTVNAQGWASECPVVKNYKWRLDPFWHRMLYSRTHMATVGVKGLTVSDEHYNCFNILDCYRCEKTFISCSTTGAWWEWWRHLRVTGPGGVDLHSTTTWHQRATATPEVARRRRRVISGLPMLWQRRWRRSGDRSAGCSRREAVAGSRRRHWRPTSAGRPPSRRSDDDGSVRRGWTTAISRSTTFIDVSSTSSTPHFDVRRQQRAACPLLCHWLQLSTDNSSAISRQGSALNCFSKSDAHCNHLNR